MRQGEAETVRFDFQNPVPIRLPLSEANRTRIQVDIDYVLFLGAQADIVDAEWIYDTSELIVTPVSQTTQALTVTIEAIAPPDDGVRFALRELYVRVNTTAPETTPPMPFTLPVMADLGAGIL